MEAEEGEMRVSYTKVEDGRLYWCNSHQCRATLINNYNGNRNCDPEGGMIMIPCNVVDLTDEVEIEEDSAS